MERLDKLLAATGRWSRREVKDLVRQGRVELDGQPAAAADVKIDPAAADIRVDGEALSYSRFTYLMLHKPAGVLSAARDSRQKTVLDLLPPELRRRGLSPVGRLDKDTEGLLLLTNDGALAQRLTHPSHGVSKTYQVTVQGDVDGAAERLAAMRDLEGEPIAPARVRTLRREGDRALLEITIHQGKNRQIRRMCAQCGLAVPRLRRIREDCLTLGGLRAGTWRDLTPEEVAALKGEAPARGPKGRPGKRA